MKWNVCGRDPKIPPLQTHPKSQHTLLHIVYLHLPAWAENQVVDREIYRNRESKRCNWLSGPLLWHESLKRKMTMLWGCDRNSSLQWSASCSVSVLPNLHCPSNKCLQWVNSKRQDSTSERETQKLKDGFAWLVTHLISNTHLWKKKKQNKTRKSIPQAVLCSRASSDRSSLESKPMCMQACQKAGKKPDSDLVIWVLPVSTKKKGQSCCFRLLKYVLPWKWKEKKIHFL